MLSLWITLRSPLFAFPSQDQKKPKVLLVKAVSSSSVSFFNNFVQKLTQWHNLFHTHYFFTSLLWVLYFFSLFTHNFPFIQLTYQKDCIIAVIKVVVSFGLEPENLLEDMLSYLTYVWSWTQGQRTSRLTSKLHPVCRQTALHCISCHGESQLIVYLWCGYTQLLGLPLDIFSEIVFLHSMHIIAWIRPSKWHTDDIEIPHIEICCVSKHW